MKLSLNWLKDYLDLPEAPYELADLLTRHVAEVEHVELQAERFAHVVVGEVLEAKRHPNADTLNIGQFDVGEEQPRQIVFGGKAVLKLGDKLPIALPGALIGPITIAERKLRGEASRGMCCLNSELQILDQAERVNFFPANTKNGTPLADALNLNDAIITIDNKTLTHRPDLFCHIGFARELSAVLKRPLKLKALTEAAGVERLPYTVRVEDTQKCRRYMGVVLDQIVIAPSPEWMQQRLRAVGLRPINNVVDITNYVMVEYGQPLHAFDYNQLQDQTVIIRHARVHESLATLDGKDHELTEQILVIADSNKAVALAGIMGGANSEITGQTTVVALESANFNPVTIRLGAQALGIRTDGSTRHEKNLPLVYPTYGFWRAIELLKEYAQAQVASNIIDDRTVQPSFAPITLSVAYVNRLAGVTLTAEAVTELLQRLGCEVNATNVDTLIVTSPPHRADLTIPEELVEEIARIYGYDQIPTQPLVAPLETQTQEPEWYMGCKLIQWLVAAGASEVLGYSFYSEADAQKFGLDPATHLRMLNPMNPDQQLLRQTQLIHLTNMAETNVQRGYHGFTLAEYGHVYFAEHELKRVAFLCVGKTEQDEAVFYQAKGLLEQVLAKTGVPVKAQPVGVTGLEYMVDNRVVAKLTLQSSAGLMVSYAEYYLTELVSTWNETVTIQTPPQYPKIELDISMEVPNAVLWQDLEKTIRQAGHGLINAVTVFDLYKGQGIAPDHKALGIRFTLQALDRTLTMDEAEKLRNTIVNQLLKRYQAKHRY